MDLLKSSEAQAYILERSSTAFRKNIINENFISALNGSNLRYLQILEKPKEHYVSTLLTEGVGGA